MANRSLSLFVQRGLPLLAVAIVLAGFLLRWLPQDNPLAMTMPEAERAALIELHSGQVRGLDDGTQLRMIASYRGLEGQLCRRYDMARDGAVRAVLACRERDGWRQRVAMQRDTRDGSFRPVSDESAMDAALEAVGAGAPLSEADEASALGGEQAPN